MDGDTDWREKAGIPRRCCVDKMTPAELAIREVVVMIEAMPASVHLTEAQILLQQARDKVADYVDGVEVKRTTP